MTVTGPLEGEARSLNGAGATFPAPLYQKWFDEYSKVTGVQVNYQAIGSGGGKGLQDQTVDFGASDAPMTDEQLAASRGGQIFHIPTALGAMYPPTTFPRSASRCASPLKRWPAFFWVTFRSGMTRAWCSIIHSSRR